MRCASALIFLVLNSTCLSLSAEENLVGTQTQLSESDQLQLKQLGLESKLLLGKKPSVFLPPNDAPFFLENREKKIAQINNDLSQNQTAAILSLRKSVDELEKRVSTLEKVAH